MTVPPHDLNEPDPPSDSWASLRASLMRHPTELTPLAPAGPTLLEFLGPAQNAEELGRLDRYRLLRCLGEGGMGCVYEAEDTHLERRVALKILLPVHSTDTRARDRFLREARAMAALTHPHIITIYEVGLAHTADGRDDLPYLAMQLLQGETLESRLLRTGPLSPPEAVRIARETAEGLAAAHACGIIHRDVKPANLWLEAPHDWVKLLDFGLAREEGRERTGLSSAGQILGTPAFMAPEQARGDPLETIDARADLFSLGCVLYTILSGEVPFDAPSVMAILTRLAVHDPQLLSQRFPHIPPELALLVQQLLAKDPAERPASAAVVIQRLRLLESQFPLGEALARPTQDVSHLPTPSSIAIPEELLPRKPAAPPSRRRFLLAGLGAVAGLGGLGALGWWWTHRGRARPVVQGVTDTEILLGMSGAFSGAARELGRGVEIGIGTWFQYLNEDGGIAGRKLRLLTLDDGYDPARALANVQNLAEHRGVFAFIGNVGTPTAEAVLPYVLDRRMIFFGAYTGTGLLRRDPPDRYVFNYRASMAEETAALVKYLLATRGVRPDQIAVFAQRDGYGDSAFDGVAKALRGHGRLRDDILRVGYERNTADVSAAVEEIRQHNEIRAVVMVPTATSAAAFIRQLKNKGPELIFTCLSFVGSEALAEALRESGPKYPAGVIVSQVVPNPTSHASAVLKYRELLAQFHPQEQPTSVSLEGYIVAALLCEGVRRAGQDLTTETLVEALESIRDLDLGLGTLLRFSPSEHQASHKVWGIVLDDKGRAQTLDLE
jgi:serine/threonine protein kinase/ABC-type branched-subunit amino acid transport system substrate-binding protein